MYTVRCSICRHQIPTPKLLISHYLTSHSKLKIIKKLLKSNILEYTPNLLKRNCKSKTKHNKKARRTIKVNPKYVKTKTLYLNENMHILCSPNEIIIGDDRSNVDTQFAFNENLCDKFVPDKDTNANIIPKKKPTSSKVSCKNNFRNSRSPSASSEASTDNTRTIKRKVKRKKMEHYRISITKLKDQQSLNEESGEFYTCHCRKRLRNARKCDLRIITSDTESCSDTNKNIFISSMERQLLFCKKCGNGYSTEKELENHMQVHETFCRLCNEYFPNEYVFREHMRLHILKVYVCHVCGREFPIWELFQIHFECHIEDRAFEAVLDMEEEYQISRYNFVNVNYSNSINSILCYLNESQDIYYSYKYMRVICEICFVEIFFWNYEQHLQNVHYLYSVS